MPKLFIDFEEILSCDCGNFKEKNKVFEPSIKYCLNSDAYCNIQGVTGGTDQTSGECSLGHTIPI